MASLAINVTVNSLIHPVRVIKCLNAKSLFVEKRSRRRLLSRLCHRVRLELWVISVGISSDKLVAPEAKQLIIAL